NGPPSTIRFKKRSTTIVNQTHRNSVRHRALRLITQERNMMRTPRFRDVMLRLLFFALLLEPGYLRRCCGRAVPHHRRRGAGVERLQNVTLTNATLSTATQLGRELSLEGCQIENFGPTLFGLLQRTDCLTLRGGTIPTVTFNSHALDTFVIDGTGLAMFSVVPTEVPYVKLRILQITRNQLRQLTPNLSLLVGLKRLDLSQNRLSYVDLDVLGSMQRLRDLDLSVNRIVRLDASPELQLPGLRNLWVSYNRLRSFGAFPGAFPALDTVRLIGNVWHCSWVDRARANIIRHGITAFGADYDCPGERQGGLCCYDDALSEEETTVGTLRLDGLTPPATGDDLTLRETNRSMPTIGVRFGDVEIFL
uniref:Uncharacterized protein n=1 Tax=Anopheles minimus TaxID=112268 RepID=A0A182VWV2_9DIPT